MPDDNGEWLGTFEAAAFIQVSPNTLRKYVRRGLIPSARDGRAFRVRRADLEAFIERCRIEPGYRGGGPY